MGMINDKCYENFLKIMLSEPYFCGRIIMSEDNRNVEYLYGN